MSHSTEHGRPDGNSSYVNLLPALPDRGGSESRCAVSIRFNGLRSPDWNRNTNPVRLIPGISICCELVPAFPVAGRICQRPSVDSA